MAEFYSFHILLYFPKRFFFLGKKNWRIRSNLKVLHLHLLSNDINNLWNDAPEPILQLTNHLYVMSKVYDSMK